MSPETKLSPCPFCGVTDFLPDALAAGVVWHQVKSGCAISSIGVAVEKWPRPTPADTAPLKRYRPTVGLGNSVGMSEIGKYNFIDCTDQDAYYLASDVDAREAARAIEVNALLLELDSAWDHVCQIENENVDVRVQAKRWDRLDKVREKIRHLKPAPKEQAL